MTYYFNSSNPRSASKLSLQLKKIIDSECLKSQKIIFLCIGSDRVCGDSLGPIIGYKLSFFKNKPFKVIGSLASPVHGVNLKDTISAITNSYVNPYIIAIDASLGQASHIGRITLGYGSLKPGLGVKKKLPEVGNIYITGIVNNSNFKDSSTLSTTRLYTIMLLADVITSAIALTFSLNPYHYTLPTPELLSAPVHSEELCESPVVFQEQ